ncbi:phosphoserine phosphatase, chloroplastic-like [Asparagus officinalis]|uniref:phosphoserine phosphatase, chloroplastic-like n=1 Tax=Asparagus officinalis TaxID=4686 RepID=UPI00098DE6DF|nr:phosphoserine phosphatase, chloroplastic-like [Asparagus officinalis]
MAKLVGTCVCHINLSNDLRCSQLPPLGFKHSSRGSWNLSFSISRHHKSLTIVASSSKSLSNMSTTHFDNTLPSREVLEIWRSADAVCFDVDSTVCVDEGIDELADFCGAGKAVAEWTAKAMSGSVPFEDALAARLSLFNPSLSQLQDFLEKRPPRY